MGKGKERKVYENYSIQDEELIVEYEGLRIFYITVSPITKGWPNRILLN